MSKNGKVLAELVKAYAKLHKVDERVAIKAVRKLMWKAS